MTPEQPDAASGVVVETTGIRAAAKRASGEASARDTGRRGCKQAEPDLSDRAARDAFRVELRDALAPLGGARDIQSVAARVLGEHLAAGRVYYLEVDPAHGHLVVSAEYAAGAPTLVGRHDLAGDGSTLAAEYAAGTTVVIRDTFDDSHAPEPLRSRWAALGIRALVGVPLVKGERLTAALVVDQSAPRAWTPAEIELIEETAERTWASAERARAEAALHRSNARLRAMAAAAPVLIWETDEEGATFVNEHYLAFFGIGMDQARGMNWAELLHPDDADGYLAAYRQAYRERRPLNYECRLRRADGRYRWLRNTGLPIGERGYVGCSLDITELVEHRHRLRVSDARLSLLLRLSDALGPLESALEIQTETMRRLGEHLGVSRALFGEVEADGDTVVVHPDYVDGVPSAAGAVSLSALGSYGTEMRRGRRVVIADAATDPRLGEGERLAYAALDAHGVVGIPLMKGGRLVAVGGVHQSEPRTWTDDDVALIEEVVERTWAAVEHARGEAAVRRSEERLRLASEAAALVSWEIDLATGLLTMGENVAGVLGVADAPADVTGAFDLVHADDVKTIEAALDRTARGEGDYAVEFRAVHPATGVIRWIESTGRLTGDRIVGVARNITEQKAAEQAARFRVNLADQLRRLSDPVEIQRAATRLLGEHLGANRAAYAEVDLDDANFVIEREYVLDAPGLVGRHRLSDFGPALVAHVRTGRTLVVHDVRDSSLQSAERAAFEAIHTRSLVTVPLVKNERWIAALAVHKTDAHVWTDAEIELVETTAERIWAAVAQARAQAEARHARDQRERLEREFVANAAHELRTPLTAIIGAVEALESGAKDEPEHRDRFFAHLTREGGRLARLADTLLFLAQADSAAGLTTELVSARALLGDIAADLDVRDGVVVEVKASPKLAVETHRGLAERVLTNLSENAAKHTDSGRIELSGRATRRAVIFEVRDTGSGMTPAAAGRAFDRFYRGGERSADGFGLGLSIARQAAAAIGATLTVEPAPEGGTVGRLVLPRQTATGAASP